jgi:hypothetical protein
VARVYRGRGPSADPGAGVRGRPADRVPAGRDLPGPDEPGRAETGGTGACRPARDRVPSRRRRGDPAADRPARPPGHIRRPSSRPSTAKGGRRSPHTVRSRHSSAGRSRSCAPPAPSWPARRHGRTWSSTTA